MPKYQVTVHDPVRVIVNASGWPQARASAINAAIIALAKHASPEVLDAIDTLRTNGASYPYDYAEIEEEIAP